MKLEEAFGFSRDEIAPILDALDPRPNQSWIKLGYGEGHGFSITEAKHLTSDPTIEKLLLALTGQGKDDSTSIQDAAFSKHNELAARMQAKADIENLPHPNSDNPSIPAEVVRAVENYFRLNAPQPLPLPFA